MELDRLRAEEERGADLLVRLPLRGLERDLKLLRRELLWSSKADAGRWALEHLDDGELIAQALRAHESREPLDPARTKPFLERAARRLTHGG